MKIKKRYARVVLGFANLVDGLVTILTLGSMCPYLTLKWAAWAAKKRYWRKK